MTEETTLKECPFCGSSDIGFLRGQQVGCDRDNGMRFVCCRGCGSRTTYLQKDDAIALWNKRKISEEKS